MKTNQTVKSLAQAEVIALSGADLDHYGRELFDSIAKGDSASWTVYSQIIDPYEALHSDINIFNATRSLPKKGFPLIPFGKVTLNKNVENHFVEVEQATFSPANVVPR